MEDDGKGEGNCTGFHAINCDVFAFLRIILDCGVRNVAACLEK